MKKALALLLFGTSILCAQSDSQQPTAKEALLIANGEYAHLGKLPNPLTDARLLGGALKKLGFHVSLVENASREGMLDALQSFQDRLKTSHGIALFHYGGHGIQVNGKNYLIPVDADIPDERKLSTRAVDQEEVMTTLDVSGSKVNVVVLDACRDNPLPATSSRSASRGLSVVQTQPKNSLIIYAAKAGQKAEDGLFTPTLATVLTQPGLSLSQVLMKVRREVAEKSNGNQTPGEYSELSDEVYLSGGENTLPPPPQDASLSQHSNMPSEALPLKPDALAGLDGSTPSAGMKSPAPNSEYHDGKQEQSPLDVVLNYYRDLNQGNFTSAWNALPVGLQQNKKIHPDGYDSFRSWFQGITPVTIQEPAVVEESPSNAIVDIQCSFKVNGKPSSLNLRYALAKDNLANRWMISSVKTNSHVSEKKYFVSGLDSNGDNWLALKSAPDLKANRLRKLPPDTPLTLLSRSGEWIKVLLDDGQEGWVYSKYVKSR